MKKLSVAVQMDPIEKINIAGDSTFALLLEAQARGHELFYYTPDRLALDGATLLDMALNFEQSSKGTFVATQRMQDGSFDERHAVDLELEPGQMSLHDIYMVHGAQANRSTQRRTGVALRYLPGSSHFDRSLRPSDGRTGVPVSFATRPLWLLRGEDRTGRNDFQIGHRP